MQALQTRFRYSALFRRVLQAYPRVRAPAAPAGEREAAIASNPSCLFKFRRAPAANSSTAAIARMAHEESTVFASPSNSLVRFGFLSTGAFSLAVNSSRYES